MKRERERERERGGGGGQTGIEQAVKLGKGLRSLANRNYK